MTFLKDLCERESDRGAEREQFAFDKLHKITNANCEESKSLSFTPVPQAQSPLSNLIQQWTQEQQ